MAATCCVPSQPNLDAHSTLLLRLTRPIPPRVSQEDGATFPRGYVELTSLIESVAPGELPDTAADIRRQCASPAPPRNLSQLKANVETLRIRLTAEGL